MEKIYLVMEHVQYESTNVISVHKKDKTALKKIKELTKGWRSVGTHAWESYGVTIYLQEMNVEE